MSTTTPFAWVATDYTRHTSTKLVNLSNKRSIPAGKRMDGLSDYERTTFSTATKKDGSAAELEEWVTGPGRDYVSSGIRHHPWVRRLHTRRHVPVALDIRSLVWFR